jgi:hypothetical protein
MSYASQSWPESTYEIETDRFGNYTIRSAGRVVKRVTSLTEYVGKPKWGSKELELKAVEDAKAAIDGFRSPVG